MKLLANLSIRAKLAATISLLIWTISVFIFIYFPSQIREERIRDLDESAYQVAKSTANLFAVAESPVDTSAVFLAMENAQITTRLMYAVAVDQYGEEIAAYKPALAESAVYLDTLNHFSTAINAYKTHAPIIRDGEIIGSVHIGLSLNEFNERLDQSLSTTAWVSFLIFLVGVITVIGASTIITNPLRNMVATVEQIAKGNLVKRARVSTQDEVGHLAFSFNKMVGNLKDAYGELENSNQTLEQRVEERTKELHEEIVERKRVEDALRESESRQRAVLSALPDLMLLRDGSGIYSPDPVLLIPPGELATGMTREQFAWSLMAEFEHSFEEAVRNSDVLIREYEIPFADATRYFEARIAPCGVDQTVTIVRDITDRKNAEAQLTLQGAALEAAANALVILDRGGKMIWVNPAFTQLTRFTAEEARGQHIRMLNAEPESTERFEELWTTISAGEVWHGEILCMRKDGEKYFEEQTVTPVLNRDNEIEHFIAIKNEITERKKIERSLIEAKESVEAADKLKDAFIANISHGIRTPLYIMIGYLNHIAAELRGHLTLEQDNYFGFIFESADRLTKSIDLILDISRLQTGNIEFQNSTIALPKLIEDRILDVKPLAAKKSISISLTNHCGNVSIKADEGFLAKCLEELLQNAVKFTKKGYVELRLLPRTDGTIAMEVEDTGIGMSEDYQARMFQISTPNNDTAGHAFEGVGLGLALVKRYLDQIGANISVRSTRGVGTVFTVEFPPSVVMSSERKAVVESFVSEKDKADASVVAEEDSALPGLLVVEDDADTRQFMQLTLKKNYRVYAAEHVSEATDIMKQHSVDIVIVDVSLGGEESGLDFVRQVRRIPRFLRTPIIAVTAHAFSSDKEKCLAAGCDRYFAKPVDHGKLMVTMRQLLESVGN